MIDNIKTGALFVEIEIIFVCKHSKQKEGQDTAPKKYDKETAHIHTHGR